MPGIDPRVMSHTLVICRDSNLVAQNKKGLGKERMLAAHAEVSKLKKVGFIREVQYTTWLANVILVKKNNGQCACAPITQI